MANNHQPASSSSSSSRQHHQLEIPEVLPGGFTIGQEIGRGSFAVVYRGLHSHTNQTVAIKAVIKSKLTNKLFQNLQDEIKILKKIRHGNVVALVDCVSNNDYIFLIMQYCSQGDLSVYIKSHAKLIKQQQQQQPNPNIHNQLNSDSPSFPHPLDGGLNEWIMRSFLGQLADALRFLRSHSIIHRDIKPQNLLLHPSQPSTQVQTTNSETHLSSPPRFVPEGIPILRVADFGFARVLAPNAGLAETLCGSPLYMAPEILRYEKYDAKADLWSVGAVLFEMAVGKPPFRAQNHVELLRKIEKSEDKIAFPAEKVVAQDLKRLILCLLKRNPAERVSFEEFFLMADQVSRVGPLIAPTTQYQHSSRLPHTSYPLRPQLTTLHGSSVQAHQKTHSPRPPSISTLPSPAAPKGKSQESVPSNPFNGEPGAFIVEEKAPAHRLKNMLQPHSGPHMNQAGATDRTPQNWQLSLPSTLRSHTHPGFQAPSPSILPTPQPSNAHRQSGWMPSFPAKYIVPGSTVSGSSNSKHGPSNVVSTAVKSKDYAMIRSLSLTSPIKQNSSPQIGLPFKSEEDEDRDLGTEYVVVEKGSVEINAMVDGLSSSSPSQQKPMSLGRRMSRGFMAAKPTLAALSSSPHRTNSSGSPSQLSLFTTTHAHPPHQHSSPVSSFPPRPHPAAPSPIPTGAHPMNIANFGRSSPSSQGHVYGAYPSSPRSFDSGGGGIGSLPIVGKYFPQSHQHSSPLSAAPTAPEVINSSAGPAPQAHHRPPYSFPSSTICRAILSADPLLVSQTTSSKSTGYGGTAALVQQPHRPSRSPPSRPQHLDAVESQLLAELEEFACKALVIVQFADDKLNAILPPPPSALGPTNTSTSSGSTSTFSGPIGAFITSSHQHPSVSEPLDASSPVDPHHARLMNDLASGSTVLTTSNKALLAGEAFVLYTKALAFLNKAIRHGIAVVDWKKLSFESAGGTSTQAHGVSSETRCAIEWLRNKYNEVFDKAEFVKTNMNGKSLLQAGSISADKLIYDRALEKSRTAAVKELVGERLGECEMEYEGSLWMLYGLLDESIMRTDTMSDVFRPEPGCSAESSFSSLSQQPAARGPQTRVESDGVERPANDDPALRPPSPTHDTFIKLSCPKIIDSILLRLLALRSLSTLPSTPPSLPNTLPTPTSSRSLDDSIHTAFK